jgi:hypothetical protein
MKQKVELEREKKAFIDSAAEKDIALRKKISTIGNIVHDSVPVSDNEVWGSCSEIYVEAHSNCLRITISCNENGPQRAARSRSGMFYHTTKC